MSQLFLTLLFAAGIGFLTMAASFAEAPPRAGSAMVTVR